MQANGQSAMWHFISENISQTTNRPFYCQHVQPVSGGDTHRAFVVRDESRRYFVKVRPAQGPAQLIHEAEGLRAISATNTIYCPSVICCGTTAEGNQSHEYLVLNHIRFHEGSAPDWAMAGQQLAALHQAPGYTEFGWPHDNYIGATPQRNEQYSTWSVFFAECRIGAMLDKLSAAGHKLVPADIFTTRIEQLLHDHLPAPSLVHGDLWTGNTGFCQNGPVIFDPAIHVADRETDLAMTELFGRLPDAFYTAYADAAPLPTEYKQRKPVYQLYHLLNHALMFGGHYLPAAKSAIIDIQHTF